MLDIMDDPVLQVSCMSGTLNILQVTPWRTPILDTILMKISTQNFQVIFFLVKQGHPWLPGSLCPPSLLSGTLKIHQVPPWRTPILDTVQIHISTQNFQSIFLWVKQGSPILDTLLLMILPPNFQGVFLWVKQGNHDIKDDHVLKVFCPEHSTSFKYPLLLTPANPF